MTKDERRAHERKISELTKTALLNWMSQPSVEHSLNVRVDLTLKQRRNSDLVTSRPSSAPTVRYKRPERGESFVEAVNAVVPVERSLIARLDDRNTVNVRVQQRRLTFGAAALTAPFSYLSAEEVQKIAVRTMNRLNQEMFGNRSHRKHNPEKLTALVCQHDRETRRHLHCLFGVPSTVTLEAFSNALRRALRSEPFVYRVQLIERVENLAASIRYNANEKKSLTNNPILYIFPKAIASSTPQEHQKHEHEDARTTYPHRDAERPDVSCRIPFAG